MRGGRTMTSRKIDPQAECEKLRRENSELKQALAIYFELIDQLKTDTKRCFEDALCASAEALEARKEAQEASSQARKAERKAWELQALLWELQSGKSKPPAKLYLIHGANEDGQS